MSRPGGKGPGERDGGRSDALDEKGGVRGCAGVGIKDGDIQRRGPPPYRRAMHSLYDEFKSAMEAPCTA